MRCPECRSEKIHKYGHMKKRVPGTKRIILTQRFRCYDCLRQFGKKGE